MEKKSKKKKLFTCLENIKPKTEKNAQESIVIFNGMRPFYFYRPKYSLSGRKLLPFLTLYGAIIYIEKSSQ